MPIGFVKIILAAGLSIISPNNFTQKFSGMTLNNKRCIQCLLSYGVALFSLLAPLLAPGDEIQNLSIDNPDGLVIASDALNAGPDYDRDAVQVSYRYQAQQTMGGEEGLYNYRFVHRLVQVRSGQTVPVLENGVPRNELMTSEQIFLEGTPGFTVTLNKDIALIPAEGLAATADHRVEVEVMRRLGSGPWEEVTEAQSSARTLYHFQNETPGDGERSVVARVEAIDVTKPGMVTDLPGNDHFQVDVALTVKRWDSFINPTPPVPADAVNVWFVLQLVRDSDGERIVLETDILSQAMILPHYTGGSNPLTPSVQTPVVSLDFRPAAQMDSTAGRHYVTVEIFTTDSTSTPFNQAWENGPLDIGEPTWFAQMNGTLRWGVVEAQLQSGQGPLNPTMVFGEQLRADLDITEAVTGPSAEYSFAGLRTVRVMPNGDGVILGSEKLTLTPNDAFTSPVWETVQYQPQEVSLGPDGVSAEALTAFFPAGFGLVQRSHPTLPWSRIADPFIEFTDGPYTLDPASFIPEVLLGGSVLSQSLSQTAASLDSFPLLWLLNSIEWFSGEGYFRTFPSGVESTTEAQHFYFENPPGGIQGSLPRRPSNDHYHRTANVLSGVPLLIATGPEGDARVETNLNLQTGSYLPHFPATGRLDYTGGQMRIVDSLLDPDESMLTGLENFRMGYQTGCPGDCNGGEASGETFLFYPDGETLFLTREGGLHNAGVTLTIDDQPIQLEWGVLPGLNPAHQSGDFVFAYAYLPGTVLGNYQTEAVSPKLAPGSLLLSGLSSDEFTPDERPMDTAFLLGEGYYPGINFLVDPSKDSGLSRIGGEVLEFGLSARSKYYIRMSGVTGIHEAEDFPASDLNIYGYPMGITQFGLSFRRGLNADSRIKGAMEVPFPAEFAQSFAELKLTCAGGLDRALPGEGSAEHVLRYWRSTINVHGLRFAPDSAAPCDPSQAYLVLASGTTPRGIAETVYGELGFFASGEIIAADNSHLTLSGAGPEGVTSRLTVPNNLTLPGPEEQTYAVNPASDLYFNSQDLDETTGTGRAGYMNLAATMGVPFFAALQVHLHLDPSAYNDSEPADRGPLYVMGGWPDDGWNEAGDHFFNVDFFDHANHGHPANLTLEAYRHPLDFLSEPERYLPRAQRTWLKVINFDYPLVFEPIAGIFRSPEPIVNENLIIVSTDHELDYLSPSVADIYFGVQFEEIPRITKVNVLQQEITGKINTGRALTRAVGDKAYETLTGGFDAFDRLLTDIPRDPIASLLESRFEPFIDGLAEELNDLLRTFDPSTFEAQGNALLTAADERLAEWDDHLDTVEAGLELRRAQALEEIAAVFGNVPGDPTAAADNLIGMIDAELVRIQLSLRMLKVGEVTIDGEQITGLLTPDTSGLPTGLQSLVAELMIEEKGASVAALIAEPLAEILATFDPALTQANESLTLLDEEIDRLRARLGAEIAGLAGVADDFAAEIREQLGDQQELLEDVVNAFFDEIIDRYRQRPRLDFQLADLYFTEADESDPLAEARIAAMQAELKTFLRETLTEKVLISPLIPRYQRIVRQRIHFIYRQQVSVVDRIFATVNSVNRMLFQRVLGPLQTSSNLVIGQINQTIEAANLRGHIHAMDEGIRRLRFDGDFIINLASRELALEGYLEIESTVSDGSEGPCQQAEGVRTVEINLGADRFPMEMFGHGVTADLGVHFNFSQGEGIPFPTGFAGHFRTVEGAFDFAAFRIENMQAMVGAGLGQEGIAEAYVAGSGDLFFRGAEARGGMFIGASCSLDPIAMIDPGVAGTLGDADRFAGIYGYGEATMNLTEQLLGLSLGCLLSLDITFGAGLYAFDEGPIYGGTLFGGVSGSILCIVSGSGDLRMTGTSTDSGFNLYGTAAVEGKIGKGRLSKSYRQDFWAEYVNREFDGGRL